MFSTQLSADGVMSGVPSSKLTNWHLGQAVTLRRTTVNLQSGLQRLQDNLERLVRNPRTLGIRVPRQSLLLIDVLDNSIVQHCRSVLEDSSFICLADGFVDRKYGRKVRDMGTVTKTERLAST
jgi:hypothetical protein